MSKLQDLEALASGWRTQEGGESGHIGSWILDLLSSAEYDGMSDDEKINLAKSSMEEIKNVADYVLKSLE